MSGRAAKPKRPMSSFMLWLNSARERIKAENPGIKMTEIVKKGAEMWRNLPDKKIWQEKAAKALEQYMMEKEAFQAANGDFKRSKPLSLNPGRKIFPAKRRKNEESEQKDVNAVKGQAEGKS